MSAILGVAGVGHTGPSTDPRECTWAPEGQPTPVVTLSLASPEWLQPSAPASSGVEIGAPCEQGSRLTAVLGSDDGDRLNARCFTDGLAVSLSAAATERSDLTDLLDLVLSRLGWIDRATFVGPAPPECVDAWRADEPAPVHCEEYAEAYAAIRNESTGG